jgi:hypothetical protein
MGNEPPLQRELRRAPAEEQVDRATLAWKKKATNGHRKIQNAGDGSL